MKKINIKIIVTLLSLVVLVSLFLFSDQIFSYTFEKYLAHFSRTALNSHLQHDGILSDATGWTVKNPRLNAKEGKAGLDFVAQSLTIKVVPRWLQREADIYVSLVGPQLEIKSQMLELSDLLVKALSPVGFLHLRPHVNIQNGELRLQGEGESKEILYFSLEAEKKKELQGQLIASFDDPDLQTPHLKIQFSNPQKHRYFIEIDADEFRAPAVSTLIHLFYPDLTGIDIQEGLVTGHLGIDLPKEGQPFAAGDLTLKQVKFDHRSLQVKGKIQVGQVHIEENKDPRLNEGDLPRTIGHVELNEGALLSFEKEGVPFCLLEDLKGTLYFQTLEGARLNLTALCKHHDQTSQLKAHGLARFGVKDGNALDLSLQLHHADSKASPATARFMTRELGAKFKFVEMTFTQIGPQEFDFLQPLLTPHIAQLSQVHLIGGKMDASVLAYMKGIQVSDFKIERLAAKNLDFTLDRWETNAHIDSVSGNLEVNLASVNPLETLNADLQISGGYCSFKELCDLTGLQTHLMIRKGVIQESVAKAQFSGLEGTLFLNGLDPNGEIVKLDFAGPFKGLSGVVPDKVREALNGGWGEDSITLKAGIKRVEKGIRLAGTLQLENEPNKTVQQVDWNFDLKRQQKDSTQLADRFWQGVIPQLWKKNRENVAVQASVASVRQMGRRVSVGGFKVSNGEFKASQILLEKYITPILFDNSPSTLSGLGNFQGEFDQSGIAFRYQLPHAIYKASAMEWEVNHAPALTDQYQGAHYFDFASGQSFGRLALKGSVCKDRRLGLTFSAVDAQLYWANKQLRWEDLKMTSCGLTFQGEINLDLRNPNPGFSETTIAIHAIQGRFSQLQNYFGHFEQLRFFQKLPLEGDLALREKGVHLSLVHTPDDWTMTSVIQGSLRNGAITANSPDLQFQELQFNFDYDQKTNTLLIKDIHSLLNVGNGTDERYSLSGEKIHFTNCELGTADFDLWLGNQTRDIVRIAGKTVPTQNEALPGSLDLILDKKLTHFGDVHPDRFELTFKDWNHIDTLQVDFDLSLATMLLDVQTLSRTGLLFLPKNLISELNSLKNGQGEFQVSIDYDAQTSLLNYKATASDVAVGEHRFQKCALQGKKKGATWAIDQLLLDETSIAADMTRMPSSWKVNFMGLRVGKSLLVGLEGDYRDGDKTFEGKVNLFEADLSKLNEWQAFAKFNQEYGCKGTLRATGQVHLEPLPSGKKNWRLDLLLNGSLRNIEVRELPFQDIQNLSLHFVTDRGLTVRGIQTALKEGENPKVLGLLNAEKIDFDTVNDQFTVESLRFNFPVENVFFTLQRLREAFPFAFSEELASTIQRLKESNNLEGAIDFKKSKDGALVELFLPEGKYQFNGQWHEVNNFKLRYDLRELKVLAQYRYNDHTFWMFIKTHPSTLNEGVILLADHHPELQKPKQGQTPLRILWTTSPDKGFIIHNAQGFLAGMEVNLIADPERPSDKEAINLSGEMRFNPSLSGCLISQDFADSCKRLQIGDGYVLKGKWRIGKNETLRFAGLLEGHEFILKGYQLQNLAAHVVYEPPLLLINDLRIVDSSGNARIDQITLTQEGSLFWKMAIPKISVANFKPSLLRENGEAPKISKPLLIKSVEFQNVNGWVGQPETWLGKGVLQFANPSKKNLQNTIFAIPAEILTLIGLDLTVLNPVSGSILFDIREGKLILLKFKDMYSDGRHSKFHLTHQKQSTVDFAGNLDVQIRMKQYNLFFKLAELLTFNINGTLLKPTYSLNKQRKL